MAKKLGIVTVNVDGRSLNSEPAAKIEVGGNDRETEMFQKATFSESPAMSVIECVIPVEPGMKITDIRNWDNVTCHCQLDTGQQLIGNGMWATEAPKIDAGKITVTFNGDPLQEVG